jgi:hypothetical protein
MKGKAYRDGELGEHVHSAAVEHAPEHEIIYGSKPAGEKRGAGETVVERQSPRASGCGVATLSRG